MSGNLGRNPAIGIRTRATKSSDAAWKAGHLAAGPWLMAAARTGYSGGAVTVVLALLLLTIGHDSPIALLVPCSATIAVIALVLIGTRKANQASRAATSPTGVTRGRSK
ncbi:SdpI family protein [Saccharopolyspora gloriosae]|uniref:SdpI family protein n=1 Tax=Saccharopolyspora gloriosae TaxID=455344 RepID=UPI001FB5AE26|nr:SdpI family protein [Saccharopolyspora gloriosae]